MTTLPVPLDYYDGPSDAAELRDYLNIIIRALNILAEWVLTPGGAPQTISPIITSSFYAWDGTYAFLPVSSAGGPITIEVPAGLGTPGHAKSVVIFKVGNDGNAVTVVDGSGNDLAFLSTGGQAFAVCVSTDTSVYAGSVT